MKAIVYTAPGVFSYTDVPEPTLRPDDVLIRVRACGLCRTDMHIHLGHFLSKFPLINGHEFAGEIVKMGAAVRDFAVGDRVVADNTELCGHCFYCRRNQPLYCDHFTSHGCNCSGGFAEFVAIRAEKVFRIRNLSWREAIMTEPISCAVHGMDMIGLRPGSEVLLFGAGPTGLVLSQLLRANGAARLVVAAPAGRKLDLAGQLARCETVDIRRQDPSAHRKAIQQLAPNGFDAIIEATGVPALFQDCFHYTRKGTQIVAYGVYPEDGKVSISPYEVFAKELVVKGSFAQTHCFDRALMYLESGVVQVNNIVTHELPLKDYGKALDLMNGHDAIKIALCP